MAPTGSNADPFTDDLPSIPRVRKPGTQEHHSSRNERERVSGRRKVRSIPDPERGSVRKSQTFRPGLRNRSDSAGVEEPLGKRSLRANRGRKSYDDGLSDDDPADAELKCISVTTKIRGRQRSIARESDEDGGDEDDAANNDEDDAANSDDDDAANNDDDDVENNDEDDEEDQDNESDGSTDSTPRPVRGSARLQRGLSQELDSENDHSLRELEFDEISKDDADIDEGEAKRSRRSLTEPRLTMRQRAMQGENTGNELAELSSPVNRKRKSSEEITRDEAMDMNKQQRARLRNLVHEKRNKERRAAMVDKVLRGVTSKRKKLSQANEALAAEVGSRLSNNEARAGFVRYVSGPAGSLICVAPGDELPAALKYPSMPVSYPPHCERDPRTGKRIISVTE